jgi:hypothetical protein
MRKGFIAVLLFLATSASADVTVCNLKEVERQPDGTQRVTACSISLDSSDHSGNQGSGGISHDHTLGTLSTDCKDLPADYLPNGQIKPFQVYDQGQTNPDDVGGLTQMMAEMGYATYGNLGFDPSQIKSLTWAAGGFDLLVYLYTAYDANGKKLGILYYGAMNPQRSVVGCYVSQ